jgi:hypothetical protein
MKETFCVVITEQYNAMVHGEKLMGSIYGVIGEV